MNEKVKTKFVANPIAFAFLTIMIILALLTIAWMVYSIVGKQSTDLILMIGLSAVFAVCTVFWIVLGIMLRFFAVVVIKDGKIMFKQCGKTLRQFDISEITHVSVVKGYKGSKHIQIQAGENLVTKKVTRGITETLNIISFSYSNKRLNLVRALYSGEITMQQ